MQSDDIIYLPIPKRSDAPGEADKRAVIARFIQQGLDGKYGPNMRRAVRTAVRRRSEALDQALSECVGTGVTPSYLRENLADVLSELSIHQELRDAQDH